MKKMSGKVSVRKSFCCVKTVLGKVSACKNFGAYFPLCSLSVQFSLCLFVSVPKKSVCKNCSARRLLCGIGSACKNADVPLFRCAKASLYKASVCKNFLRV